MMREEMEISGFDALVGREDIIRHLQSAIHENKVNHAYIFSGEKGSGKRMMASVFARTLLCEEGGTEPCNHCTACKKILSGNHPDVKFLTHEKPNTVGIDDVRDQLVGDVQIRPYESRYKIYIVDEASKMTPQAQNAILKTIEEPPAYAIIMLLADNPEALLPTIRSRSVTLSFRPVSEEQIREFLMKQMHVPDYQAEIEASFAQGNIGRAKRIAESSDFIELAQSAVQLLKRSKTMEVADMVEAIKRLTADRQTIYDYLELFTMWFRDVLVFKATREIDGLIFKEEINAIQERAQISAYEGLEEIVEAIATATSRLRANVNFELTMELLFLTIREN